MTNIESDHLETPLGYYEKAIAELTKARTEFQSIKTELQNYYEIELQTLKAELQTTKLELNAAYQRIENLSNESRIIANKAENIANTAMQEIETVKTGIEEGKIIAQKALILQGKDENYGLKFRNLDSIDHHCFQVWNSQDYTWSTMSGVGINYRKLEQLLSLGKWKEADQETFNKILELTGQEKEDSFREEHINIIPGEELKTIDQLWLKYSHGQFGFSVQKQIYQELQGSKQYAPEIWQDFNRRVGWYVNRQLLWYRYLNFATTAPKGHLPGKIWDNWRGDGVGSLYALIFKLLDCDL